MSIPVLNWLEAIDSWGDPCWEISSVFGSASIGEVTDNGRYVGCFYDMREQPGDRLKLFFSEYLVDVVVWVEGQVCTTGHERMKCVRTRAAAGLPTP